jgi:hypothetical protein
VHYMLDGSSFLAFRQLFALAEGGQGANSIWRQSDPPTLVVKGLIILLT